MKKVAFRKEEARLPRRARILGEEGRFVKGREVPKRIICHSICACANSESHIR